MPYTLSNIQGMCDLRDKRKQVTATKVAGILHPRSVSKVFHILNEEQICVSLVANILFHYESIYFGDTRQKAFESLLYFCDYKGFLKWVPGMGSLTLVRGKVGLKQTAQFFTL